MMDLLFWCIPVVLIIATTLAVVVEWRRGILYTRRIRREQLLVQQVMVSLEADAPNAAALASIANDIAAHYGRDWVVIGCGNFEPHSQTYFHVGFHDRVRDREDETFQKIERGALFLKRLLEHADGDQLPPGLQALIRSLSIQLTKKSA